MSIADIVTAICLNADTIEMDYKKVWTIRNNGKPTVCCRYCFQLTLVGKMLRPEFSNKVK